MKKKKLKKLEALVNEYLEDRNEEIINELDLNMLPGWERDEIDILKDDINLINSKLGYYKNKHGDWVYHKNGVLKNPHSIVTRLSTAEDRINTLKREQQKLKADINVLRGKQLFISICLILFSIVLIVLFAIVIP